MVLRLFIDECLSPRLARQLRSSNIDAVDPLAYGRRGDQDHIVLQRCAAETRVIVTHNIRDFRKLVGNLSLHPGIIALPEDVFAATEQALRNAVSYINEHRGAAEADDWMINKIVTVKEDGDVWHEELPPLR